MNDFVALFSVPYSILFLYSLFVLIQQKRCTKTDCIFLAFICFVIFLNCFFHFLSKRYSILLFFPSILIIGKAFSLTLHHRILFWGFIPLLAFCFIYHGIKFYNTVALPNYGFYLGQPQQVTHTNSYNFFLSAEDNLDERNRIAFYLQKELFFYPEHLTYNKQDYDSTQISGNEPFYYIVKRKTASEYKPFRNLNGDSNDFKPVLSFYTDKHHKKKIEIIRANQLSAAFRTSTFPSVLSSSKVIIENFSNPVSESKTKYFTFDHNRVIDFLPTEFRFSEILIDNKYSFPFNFFPIKFFIFIFVFCIII